MDGRCYIFFSSCYLRRDVLQLGKARITCIPESSYRTAIIRHTLMQPNVFSTPHQIVIGYSICNLDVKNNTETNKMLRIILKLIRSQDTSLNLESIHSKLLSSITLFTDANSPRYQLFYYLPSRRMLMLDRPHAWHAVKVVFKSLPIKTPPPQKKKKRMKKGRPKLSAPQSPPPQPTQISGV